MSYICRARLCLMDVVHSVWAWAAAHPWQSAWVVFAALSALVAVYKANEGRIKARVTATDTKADDKLVRVLDALVAVFEVLRLLVPHGIGRPKRGS